MSIQIENLIKIYGKQKALDGISFKTEAGEIIGLVGPNGAGKSTLMKIISCYLPQTSGNAFVCGFDVIEQSIEVRKKVGYLPEHNPLYLDMYIPEYLSFVAGIYKLGKTTNVRVAEMIEITGLLPERRKKIGALSKGYRQRVGIAQALIHNPEVLILDEPTSGLDPNQILEIRNLIKAIGKEKTVLFSTHIMQEVEAVCDRVIILDHGKIITDQKTEELHHSLNTSIQVISIEFDKLVEEELLMNIPGIIQVEKMDGNLWKVKANKEKDIRPLLFNFAVEHNVTVLYMNMEEQSLEETFFRLTKNK